MGSEVRVIETPGLGTDYWLGRCEGFEVDGPEGRLGVVEWLVFGSRLDRPDALAVHTGHVLRRSVLIPVDDVKRVLPEEKRITLAVNPAPVGRVRTLRSRLAPGTTSKRSSASPLYDSGGPGGPTRPRQRIRLSAAAIGVSNSAMASTKSRMRRAIEDALQPRELTRAELYEEARALGIEGRSKMNKGALKAAVGRRQRELVAPRI